MATVLRKLPDLSTEAHWRQFWTSVGDDTLIVSGRTRSGGYPAQPERLSVRAVWGGRAEYSAGSNRLVVDDDCYLVINGGSEGSLRLQAPQDVEWLSVHYSPATAAAALPRVAGSVDDWLDGRTPAAPAVPRFAEHLRPHDRLVTPALIALARQAELGTAPDALQCEERALTILERLGRMHGEERTHILELAQVRLRTKREIHRRIWAATDFLLSSYDRPLTLQQLADVACLAKYHFLRMFVAVHGLTPMEFLRCKRVAVASRLLRSTSLSLVEIAHIVGVADRSTLLRLFVEYCDQTPEEYRRRPRVAGEARPSPTWLKELLSARARADAEQPRVAATPVAASSEATASL
jgi:AraC family transcriptional regulator